MIDQIQSSVVESAVANDYNGFIYAATGFGKTKTVLDILKKYSKYYPSPKFLWVVPTSKLRDKGVPDEISKWNATHLDIDIICYASLHKLDNKDSIYDIIVLDECHHINENRYNYIKDKSKKYIGITATKPVEEDRLELLESLGDTIFEYTLDEAVKDNIVDDYEIIVIQMNLDRYKKYIEVGRKDNKFLVSEQKNYDYLDAQFRRSLILKKHNPKNTWQFTNAVQKRASALYTYQSKIDAAKELLDILYNDEQRVLIVSQRIEVSNQLCEYRYHSEDRNGYEPFIKGEVNRLSACSSLDEGENLPNLDSVFIVSSSSKTRQLVQRCGRSVRKSDKDKARIYILCYSNTQDEKWVDQAVKGFKNVTYTTLKEIKNKHSKI